MGGGQEDLPPSIIATFQGGLNQHPHCIRHWVPFLYWFNQKWESVHKFGLFGCLFVCLSVCLYPINVKTAEPIGPNFFVGHLGTPGQVYESSKFQIFVSIKIRSSLNFWKFWKSTKFFVKIRELLCFVLRCTQR